MIGNILKRSGLLLTFFCLCLLAAGPANAGYVEYDDLFGSAVDFIDIREISTTNPDQSLYGAPILAGNATLLFPTNFSSTATGGAADTTDGTLEMTLSAKTGFAISGVRITEIGSYALTGTNGTVNTNASVSGTLTVGGSSVPLAPTSTGGTLSFAMPNDSTGSYNATAYLDFSGLGYTELAFSLSNLLATNSEAGTTATIQKSFESNKVEVEFFTAPVPLPGALWLLGSALGPLCWMRRRSHSRG